MPKIKDLGVTIVPEQFAPLEIGPGVGRCEQNTNVCSSCTNEMARLTIMPPLHVAGFGPGVGRCEQNTTVGSRGTKEMARLTIMPPLHVAGACTDCTAQAFSICGTSPGPQFCTDCTQRPWSLCGPTPIGPACRFTTIDPWTPHCGG